MLVHNDYGKLASVCVLGIMCWHTDCTIMCHKNAEMTHWGCATKKQEGIPQVCATKMQVQVHPIQHCNARTEEVRPRVGLWTVGCHIMPCLLLRPSPTLFSGKLPVKGYFTSTTCPPHGPLEQVRGLQVDACCKRVEGASVCKSSKGLRYQPKKENGVGSMMN